MDNWKKEKFRVLFRQWKIYGGGQSAKGIDLRQANKNGNESHRGNRRRADHAQIGRRILEIS
jgi:hypothetical protein